MVSAPVVVAGCLAGAGVALVVQGLLATTPDLPTTLDRLHGHNEPAPTPIGQRGLRGLRRGDAALLGAFPRMVDTFAPTRWRADLTLVGMTPESFAARKLGYALLGLVFPALLAAGMALLGVHPPITLPVAVSLALAAGLFFVPDVDLRRRAAAARDELRRAVCAYCELVALERAGDAGTVEALERAATVADSAGFVRIRDALLRAELAGNPPWQGLKDLADTVGVRELGDIADIMRLSGEDGAAVYNTLRARASSLRTQLLTTSTAQANAASEHMIVPVALLGIAFMALVGYPAFARILFG